MRSACGPRVCGPKSDHRTHQDDLGLIEFLLHLHDGIRLARVLILRNVRVRLRERYRGRARIRRDGDLCDEVVEQLREE